MLKNILNIEGLSILDKTQQSKVQGQACSIYSPGAGWSAQTVSVETAQEFYDGGSGDAWYSLGGLSVTGYCCASCHTFTNHPAHHSGNQGPMLA
jgi:hypothetical protein